jgi:hypothetical protein
MTDLTFQREDLLVPPGTLRAWQGDQAVAFRECIAAEFDNLAISAELVGKARSPLLCDATVLPYHGRDRKIRRYVTETETSYRIRLSKWRQIWASAGRAWGILRQLRIFLAPYGRPLLRYVSTTGDGAESQWLSLAPGDGANDYFEIGGLDPEFSRHLSIVGNWKWDAAASAGQYSRFWILIYTDGITSPSAETGTWDGTGEWDGTTVWDSALLSTQITDVVSLCSEWKAAHSQLNGVLLVPDESIFDPTGTPSTVAPWGYSTFPDSNYDDLSKRHPDVVYAYAR